MGTVICELLGMPGALFGLLASDAFLFEVQS